MKVVIIGSGNVAEALAKAVAHSGTELTAVAARNAERGSEVARMAGCRYCALDDAPSADLYVIAVSDRAVAEAEAAARIAAGSVVAHTAGAVGIDTLTSIDRAVFYPFQTFTSGREVDFADIPIFIEGSNPKALAAVRRLAESLSDTVIEADSAMRERIHLAGAFACNFTNRMYGTGNEMLAETGLPFDILKPLIAETAAKALATDSPAEVQTGAAVRGDSRTQQRHLELLAGDERKTEIYKLISRDIWETSKKI